MQHILITAPITRPNSPAFKKGQKVRVSDKLADDLVKRGQAMYDKGENAKTEKAKAERREKTKKIKT